MQRALEAALDGAEDVLERVRQRPRKGRSWSSGGKSLREKLYDIYVEECNKQPEVEELRSRVSLLERVVRRESLPCLVVNLYPGDMGYSLMLRDDTGSYSESIRVPYTGGELLEYLDAEQLPPILLDVLENSEMELFHSGCVIAEIRDYRQGTHMEPLGYQSRHMLLRPATQTLVCDVQATASHNHQWSQEEKLELESQLIQATAEPLCLDPSVAVACTANSPLYNKQKMQTAPIGHCFKMHSWPSVVRQQQLSRCPPPPDLETLTACKKRWESRSSHPYDLQISTAGKCIDTWKQRPCDLAVPSEVDVHKYATVKPSFPSCDPQPTIWPVQEAKDDDVFESEAGSQPWEVKASVMQSFNDPFISGSFKKKRNRQPHKEGRRKCQLCLPQVPTVAHSDGWSTGAKPEAGEAGSVHQEPVPGEVACPGNMPHGACSSASPSQPFLGQKPEQPTTESGEWELESGNGVSAPAEGFPPPSFTRRRCSRVSHPSGQASSSRKLPRLAPAPPKPSCLTQVWVELLEFCTLPQAAPATSSSESTPATQGPASSSGLNVIDMVGPAQGAPVWVSDSQEAQGLPAGPPAPSGTCASSSLSPAGQLPSAQPGALQVILNNTSRPITLQFPAGYLILNPEEQEGQLPQTETETQTETQPLPQSLPQSGPLPQPESVPLPEPQPFPMPQSLPLLQPLSQSLPQPLPQQHSQPQPLTQPLPHSQPQPLPHSELYQLLSQQQLQPATPPLPAQPVPGPSAQGLSSQQWVSPAAQDAVINDAGVRRFLELQAALVPPPSPVQPEPGPQLPGQGFQLPAAQAQWLQAQAQNAQPSFEQP